jgi:ribonuclease P protein component
MAAAAAGSRVRVRAALHDAARRHTRRRIGRRGLTGHRRASISARVAMALPDTEVIREADLPAEPARAQAPPRLPRPHGDQGRPPGDRPAPRLRAQAPVRLTAGEPDGRPALVGLRRRAEFLAAAKGTRVHKPAFVLQVGRRAASPGEVGVGLTVTRKLGGAVQRNRIRRRLRAALREAAGALRSGGLDLVIVARPAALACPFEQLVRQLREAFSSRQLGPGRAASRPPS